MGASIDGREGGRFAPLVVRGGSLHGIDYDQPVASAQVKSAVLLAGLGRRGRDGRARAGPQPGPHRGDAGAGRRRHRGRRRAVRRAPAALDARAAGVDRARRPLPGGVLAGRRGRRARLGPDRRGPLPGTLPGRLPRRAGADGGRPGDRRTGGPRRACVGSALHGTDVAPEEIPGLVDEVPALAVAAALAEGVDLLPRRRRAAGQGVRPAGHDRLRSSASSVRRSRRRPTSWSCAAAGRDRAGGRGGRATATTASPWRRRWPAWPPTGETVVAGTDAIATSYPGFVDDLGSRWRGGGAGRGGRALSDVLVVDARRPGRYRQVDGRPGAGGAPRRRLPRHRGHVPGGDLGGAARRTGRCAGREPGRPARTLGAWPRASTSALDAGTGRVTVDGTDVTADIRGPEVTAAVSAVSAVPEVRAVLRRPAAGVDGRAAGAAWSRVATWARSCSPTRPSRCS